MARLLILACASVLMIAPAYAEDAAPTQVPSPSPTPIANPVLWHIEGDLEKQDIAAINSCVGELPKKVADPLVQKISSMIKAVK